MYSLWKERPNQKEQAMSDNLRRYRARRDALTQCYPGQPSGTVARHPSPSRRSSAASWAVRAPNCRTSPRNSSTAPNPKAGQPFPAVARQRPHPGGGGLLPDVDVLPRHLALQTVVLVMDGSGVGRGCTALMIHVVYKGRALPLAWRVRQAPRATFLKTSTLPWSS